MPSSSAARTRALRCCSRCTRAVSAAAAAASAPAAAAAARPLRRRRAQMAVASLPFRTSPAGTSAPPGCSSTTAHGHAAMRTLVTTRLGYNPSPHALQGVESGWAGNEMAPRLAPLYSLHSQYHRAPSPSPPPWRGGSGAAAVTAF